MNKALPIARGLFFLNAAIWLALGISSLSRPGNNGPASPLTLLIVALLLFVNSGAMLVAGWGLGTRWKLFYYFAILLLLGNIILTFTDQFGFLDFVTLLLDCALLGILILHRKVFLQTNSSINNFSLP